MEAVRVRARGSMAAILGGEVAHSGGKMDPKPLKLPAGARSFPRVKVHCSAEMTCIQPWVARMINGQSLAFDSHTKTS